jgi:Flp pilus assembly pilin Flp
MLFTTDSGGAAMPMVPRSLNDPHAANPLAELSAQSPVLVSAPLLGVHEPLGEVKRMTYLNSYLTRLLGAARREEGQTMAEYGVILAVITVAIIAVLVLLSDGIRNNLQAVVDALS